MKSKVIPVRIDSKLFTEIRKEAKAMGIGVSTFMRVLIKEKMKEIRKQSEKSQ